MPKSKDGDGRRGNRPPDNHKIRPGEIRNPNGRRGKSGILSTSGIDQFMLDEARRIVSRDEHGEVSAAKRLVQEEYVAALREKDPKARARLLKSLSSIEAAMEKQLLENLEWLFTCLAKYEELFRVAQVRRFTPPDILHPSHVHYRNGAIVLTGPADGAARKGWEHLKGYIKVCAWLHAQARQDWKQAPTTENLAELKRLEAHRRRLMRQVPNGWNWREEIYCRYSRADFVKETIASLEAMS